MQGRNQPLSSDPWNGFTLPSFQLPAHPSSMAMATEMGSSPAPPDRDGRTAAACVPQLLQMGNSTVRSRPETLAAAGAPTFADLHRLFSSSSDGLVCTLVLLHYLKVLHFGIHSILSCLLFRPSAAAFDFLLVKVSGS